MLTRRPFLLTPLIAPLASGGVLRAVSRLSASISAISSMVRSALSPPEA